jgi:hypothetical protein
MVQPTTKRLKTEMWQEINRIEYGKTGDILRAVDKVLLNYHRNNEIHM